MKKNNGYKISSCTIHSAHCQKRQQRTQRKVRKNRIPKPPPIYIDAKVIDPLIELLNNTAEKDNYVIKQIKIDQVKVQTNTPEIFRKITRSLKEKKAAYHTFQIKTDKSYKAVIRGLHPKTNTGKISEELAKIGHQVRSINNINK